MTENLFRREVLEHRKQRALGDVILINPPSFFLLTGAVALVLAAFAAFLWWGQYARKETVVGYLVPDKGLVKLHAPFAGIVTERRVEEGARVRAGDILFVITANRSSTSARSVDATLIVEVERNRAVVQEQIEQEQRANAMEVRSLEDESASLKAELVKSAQERDIQRRRLELDGQTLERFRTLADQGHLSVQQFQQREREHLELQALVEALERNRLALVRQRQATESRVGIAKLRSASRIADYETEISQLDQQLAELNTRAGFAVRAPVDGVATGVVTEIGQSVAPDAPLLTILPEGSSLEARVYLPTRAAGFVKPGQEVLVRFHAFPYQRFGLYRGVVARVSRAILAPNEIQAPMSLSEPVYTVTVTLERQTVDAYGEALPLTPGMLLEADVVLDRHNLLRWLLDPLYSLKGKL